MSGFGTQKTGNTVLDRKKFPSSRTEQEIFIIVLVLVLCSFCTCSVPEHREIYSVCTTQKSGKKNTQK